ncbi:MAG TPA: helix-turn-helix domain-containing protein [Ktedonobacterales bacterium]|nr:helix-turn-helix domain-containing protein [Ktedonobacterales bacterium]
MLERTSLSLLLKRYRMAAGLSQEALAQRADLSTRVISDLERGLHRSLRGTTLDLLASARSLSAQQRVLLLAAARPDLIDVPLEMAQYASPTEIPGLPTPPTAVVGRESESAELRALLHRNATRLVTVTGPSGVGKTRIALHVAHEIAPAYGDGALFVDLALIRDAGLVPSAVAYALQLREQGGTPLDQQIRSYLREKRMLLVLDNFEQVIESAPFVADLLTWCPNIAIIVTSRMPLRLRGEHAIQLAPLPLEDAIVLFRERTHSVRQGELFSVTGAAAICERVDCLPLAIEIVAGQVGLLSLPQILNTLYQHMGLNSRARGTCRHASERWRQPSTGATTCSRPINSVVSGRWLFSWAALRSTPRARSVGATRCSGSKRRC